MPASGALPWGQAHIEVRELQTLGVVAPPLKAEHIDFRVWEVLVSRKTSWDPMFEHLRREEMALRWLHALSP